MRPRALALILLALAAPAPAIAAPEPLDPALFAFPGAVVGPGGAASAGVALADRWLGDEPFSNPAARPARGLVASPALARVSRQDLRSDNRAYDEQPLFLDVAGAHLALPAGPATLFAYAWQPVTRSEDNAFERGIRQVPPAVVRTVSSQREWRAGAGAAWGFGALTVGLAGEWTVRSDAYETLEQSGSPDAGTRELAFDGSGFGGQAGVRWDHRPAERWGVSVGAAVRAVPALSLEGEQTRDLVSGAGTTAIAAEREAGLEAGVSARVRVHETVRVVVGLGGRTERAWTGLDVAEGPAAEWRIGLDLHRDGEPWTVRAGGGEEQQRGVPEPRAGVVAIGFGWQLETTRLDVGIVRRSLERAGQPVSFDDRVVGSVTIAF